MTIPSPFEELLNILISESPLSLLRAVQLALLQIAEDLTFRTLENFGDLLNSVDFHKVKIASIMALLYYDKRKRSTFVRPQNDYENEREKDK